MSAIDAFYSTWSQARESFGSGVPQDGSEFDKSNQLRQLQSSVQGAAPDSRWQGPAADAYAAKNAQHAATYGKLADLDQRMAAEVSKTAGVVTAGRQNLDQIRDWVASAAASAPSDRSGETMKVAIASKGLSQISEIIQQSNDQMNAIGERIRGIGREYDEIGGDKGKNKLDAWKQNPPIYTDDDGRTHDEKVADWLVRYNDLCQKITEHAKTLPPPNAPASVGNAYNKKKDELMKEMGDLVQEGVELGIPFDPPTAQGVMSDRAATSAPIPGTIRSSNPTKPALS